MQSGGNEFLGNVINRLHTRMHDGQPFGAPEVGHGDGEAQLLHVRAVPHPHDLAPQVLQHTGRQPRGSIVKTVLCATKSPCRAGVQHAPNLRSCCAQSNMLAGALASETQN